MVESVKWRAMEMRNTLAIPGATMRAARIGPHTPAACAATKDKHFEMWVAALGAEECVLRFWSGYFVSPVVSMGQVSGIAALVKSFVNISSSTCPCTCLGSPCVCLWVSEGKNNIIEGSPHVCE